MKHKPEATKPSQMLKLWKKASLPALSEKPEAEKEDRQHTRSSQNHHEPPSFLFSPEVPYTWLLHWEHITGFEITEIRGKIGQNPQARARCCASVLTAPHPSCKGCTRPKGRAGAVPAPQTGLHILSSHRGNVWTGCHSSKGMYLPQGADSPPGSIKDWETTEP